ncbi:unnamed protein product, partial [Ectocarpus sp. 12 AP-2014]
RQTSELAYNNNGRRIKWRHRLVWWCLGGQQQDSWRWWAAKEDGEEQLDSQHEAHGTVAQKDERCETCPRCVEDAPRRPAVPDG